MQLHSYIADAYRQLKKYRLARIYVERIYRPLCTFDNRINQQNFPLQLPPEANRTLYAQLLIVAARISLVHGQVGKAKWELRQARRLLNHQENREISIIMEEIDKRPKGKAERRQLAMIRKSQIDDEKLRAAIGIAAQRLLKGDQAYSNNDQTLATQKYHAAAVKLVDPYGSCIYYREARILLFEAVTKLTIISMNLHDYEAVHGWANILHDIRHDGLYHQITTASYEKAIPETGQGFITSLYADDLPYEKMADHIASYCKAVAYQAEGN